VRAIVENEDDVPIHHHASLKGKTRIRARLSSTETGVFQGQISIFNNCLARRSSARLVMGQHPLAPSSRCGPGKAAKMAG
jgi:hypothetical protein